jgi:hypothetical protein
MKPLHSAKLRRYRHIAKVVGRLVRSGEFQQLAASKRRSLLAKLKQRLLAIRQLMPESRLRQGLAACSLLLGLGIAPQLQAQSFAPPVLAPFGLNAGEVQGLPTFTDIDSDGDLDLFTVQYDYYTYSQKMYFFENAGTAQNPSFSSNASVVNPFGLQMPSYVTTAAFADLDNDGDQDLLLGTYYNNGLYFLKNVGTPTAPAFAAPESNALGLQTASETQIPVFADLDNDGDQDILAVGYDGSFIFFENGGTPEIPAFQPPVNNPFGLETGGNPYLVLHTLADLDADGDKDLIYTSLEDFYQGMSVYFVENTGTPSASSFAEALPNPFGITTSSIIVAPALADIDGDGDADLFMQDFLNNTMSFHENTSVFTQVPPLAANGQVTALEDQEFFFSPEDFNFFDPNQGDVLQAVEVITMLPMNGTLKLNGNPIVASQVIAAADIPALSFTPLPDGNGSPYAAFTFRVSDGANWSTNAYTMNIDVLPVNDAPASADAQVNLAVNQVYDFSAQDFPFSDVDGDNLQLIRLAENVDRGILRLGAAQVTVGQEIPLAALPSLNFTPVIGEQGTPYTAFKFEVSDGDAFSDVAYTMTINVGTVNDFTPEKPGLAARIYPNPAVSSVWLEGTLPLAGQVEVSIFDAAGRLHLSREFPRQEGPFLHLLDVRQLSSGQYQVRVAADGMEQTLQLVRL